MFASRIMTRAPGDSRGDIKTGVSEHLLYVIASLEEKHPFLQTETPRRLERSSDGVVSSDGVASKRRGVLGWRHVRSSASPGGRPSADTVHAAI